jgi:hypothetical protein
LINDKYDFNDCNKEIIKIKSYSLSIFLKELIIEILNDSFNILEKLPKIISELSDLENMVTKSTFTDIYISALIGIFKQDLK